jgi:hypothetical protein
MKGVAHCDKLWGARVQALYPEIPEWGNPRRQTLRTPD